MFKYKQAYELLWSFIETHELVGDRIELLKELSDDLDDIFGADRRC